MKAPQRIEDLTEPEMERLTSAMGRAVEFVAGRLGVERPLFCLLLFNDPRMTDMVSNTRSEDLPAALRETADHIEAECREGLTR